VFLSRCAGPRPTGTVTRTTPRDRSYDRQMPPDELLLRLGMVVPVIGAPMAGGPAGPPLVLAVNDAGGLGFLGAGYKTAQALADEIRVVRAAGTPFGVNLFAPPPVPIEPAEFRAYARRIAPEAARYDLDLSDAELIEDDDGWLAKIDLLLADPVPLVSVTFGLPDASMVAAFQRAGTAVAVTVTSAGEAALAAELKPDLLLVQGSAAGGHSGTFTPSRVPDPIPLPDLVRAVRSVTGLPLVGAGGIGTTDQAAAALQAGAAAIAIGTLLLRTDESEASATHQAALADPARRGTVVTRAFTGRPARALRNEFSDRYSAAAPLGYPAVHYLTRAMRKAAAAAGDPERVHLWAGTGYQHAETGPAAAAVARLASGL
jgi:nitronate monooxygenase